MKFPGNTQPNSIHMHCKLPPSPFLCLHLMSASSQRIFSNSKKGCGVVVKLHSSISMRSRSSPVADRMPSRDTRSDSKESRSNSFYTHPSLLQMKNERMANRKRVYEFLKSIGIVPDELDGLELPVTVEVMKERVDFLHKLGLTIEDINNYPLVLGCSVKKNMVPVLDYLGKLGVRKSSLTEFLRRYPQVLHASVVVDLAPVVNYLQGMDIKPGDIYRVLETYPEVLGFKLEGTMSTSVAYLVGIGVARREIGEVLTRHPEILGMRVGRIIKPLCEYLKNLGMTSSGIARLIEKLPQVLSFDLENRVKPNVKLLLECHVRPSSIPGMISQYPEIIGMNLGAQLGCSQELLGSTVDMNPEEFGRALEKMPQVVSLNEQAVARHVDFLKECGFSREQVKKMALVCPQLLALNINVMNSSFDYFKSSMNRPLDDVVNFPAYFTYGLETTIKRRHQMVVRKGISCSLSWLLNCSHERFEERMSYDLVGMEEMEVNTADELIESPLEASEYEDDSEEEDDDDVDM